MRNNDIMLFVRCCKCRGVLCCARCWQVSTEEKKKNVSWAWFAIGSRGRAKPIRFAPFVLLRGLKKMIKARLG